MYQVVDCKLRSSFREALGDGVALYSEYGDFSRFPDANHTRKFLEFLHDEFSTHGFDLIFVVGASALDAVQADRDRFFPATPVVYCRVTDAEFKTRKIQVGITGVPAKLLAEVSAILPLRTRW